MLKASTEGNFLKKSGENLAVAFAMNSNTVKEIKRNGSVVAPTNYTAGADSVIFTGAYLESLAAGNHEFTVSYNPQGVAAAAQASSDPVGTTIITVAVTGQTQPPGGCLG